MRGHYSRFPPDFCPLWAVEQLQVLAKRPPELARVTKLGQHGFLFGAIRKQVIEVSLLQQVSFLAERQLGAIGAMPPSSAASRFRLTSVPPKQLRNAGITPVLVFHRRHPLDQLVSEVGANQHTTCTSPVDGQLA